MSNRYTALCDPRWEREEQRAVETSPDYQPTARRGSVDDPFGPSDWDRRSR
ncbi:hypothetical protein [Nocardia sp. NPDC004260]